MDDEVGSGAPYVPTLLGIRAVLEVSAEPTIVLDADEIIRVANPAACEFLGYAAPELVDRKVDVLVPDGREGQIKELRQAWGASLGAGRLGSSMDVRARRADGSQAPVELHVTAVSTTEGDVVLVALRDVTAAQRDTRLFRGLLEAAPDAIVIVDEVGLIRFVNEATERVFGYERDELVGRALEILVPARVARHHQHLRQSLFRVPHPRPMEQAGTLTGRRKDGSEFPVEISLAPVTTEEGPLMIAAVRDVTERLEAADACAQQKNSSESWRRPTGPRTSSLRRSRTSSVLRWHQSSGSAN